MKGFRFAEAVLALAGMAMLFFLVLFFLLPLGASFSPIITSSAIKDLSSISLTKVIAFTFSQALCSVFISLIVGLPAAFFLARRNFPGKKILSSTSAVPLCMPSLIVALAYIACFGVSGLYNKIFVNIFSLKESPFTFLYSFWGIILAQGFYNFPLVMQTVADGWSEIDSREEDSARILGAGEGRVFFTITFWKLLPFIISACVPVFIYCFFSFMIVLMFGALGTTTLETAIYVLGSNVHSLKGAALLSLVETLSALFVLLLYSLLEKKSVLYVKDPGQKKSLPPKNMSKMEVLFFVLFIFVILIFFFVPFATIVSGAMGKIIKVLSMKSLYLSIKNTILSASATALFSTASALCYALLLLYSNKINRGVFLKVLPLMPMAVSSVVLALGMTRLFKQTSPLVLVLSQSALAWPFAFRQIYSSLVKLPSETLQSSIMLSGSRLDSAFRVVMPSCRRGILSALGFTFAISAGDASFPLVLSVPKFDTLALFTYRLAGSYRFNEACASGLVLALLCMGVFYISNSLKGGSAWHGLKQTVLKKNGTV